jgi:predicted PurR-regulated permease PerM
MNAKMLQPYFLAASIALATVLAFFIFRPFLIVLILAAIFAVVLQPLYRKFIGRMSASPGLAALLTIAVTVVCLLVPLLVITSLIVGDARDLYGSLTSSNETTSIHAASEYANNVLAQYAPGFALSGIDLATAVDTYIEGGLAWLIRHVGGAFGQAAGLLLDIFVFLIALYYLLKDGSRLKQRIVEASPLANMHDELVFSRLELAVNSVIRGSLTIAFIQGVLTAVGFTIFGVPNGVLWGVVAVFAALIPGIGTSLVLVPGIIYLFVTGAAAPAVGLIIWSALAVGLIDNLLGPRLVGKGMQLHPLIVLLSVFGGLAFFGAAGIFLGPLCISLLFALVSIYQTTAAQAA